MPVACCLGTLTPASSRLFIRSGRASAGVESPVSGVALTLEFPFAGFLACRGTKEVASFLKSRSSGSAEMTAVVLVGNSGGGGRGGRWGGGGGSLDVDCDGGGGGGSGGTTWGEKGVIGS